MINPFVRCEDNSLVLLQACHTSQSRLVALEPVPVQEAVKRGAIDAGAPRGLRQVAAGIRDRARQELPIELLQEPIAGIVIAVVRTRAGRVLEAEPPVAGRGRYTKEGDVCGADLRRRLEQLDRMLDDALELADVARPRVRLEGGDGALAEARDC